MITIDSPLERVNYPDRITGGSCDGPSVILNAMYYLSAWSSVRHAGRVMEARALQQLKAPSPMLVHELGSTIEGRESQPKKAESPTLVSPACSTIEVREVHQSKA